MSPATARAVDGMIAELQQEAQATRRMLEAVPADKLTWKPHEKSWTIGQLALHIAGTPGGISQLLQGDGIDGSQVDFNQAEPESKEQILAKLEESMEMATKALDEMGDEHAMDSWTLSNGDAEVFTVPKIGLARSLMMNHWYHHRGQMCVYLRLLDVPVPACYGRSADESQFG